MLTMNMQTGLLCVVLVGVCSALICPDGGVCQERNTCCQNPSGGYGCCPLPNAECCSDHLHCCYEGTVCDLVHSKCLNKTVSLPWVRRLPANQLLLIPLEGVKAIICPDQESECPEDTTCCQLPDGSWGCCPLPKAVCCDDKRHCCPVGTKCDTAHSKCMSATRSFPMLEKLPARRRKNKPAVGVTSVTCADGKSTCPDGSTCCLLVSGDYGCCLYPEAVCCSDQVHCCPANTTCDVTHETCRSGETLVPMVKKVPALPKDVVCPDKTSLCPDDTTCCQTASGDYGCCPMPNAVCCSDHVHCCPANTTCDVEHEMCSSGETQVPMVKKVPALPNDVVCPDEVSTCPDDTTCCKMASGTYGCCPMPNAVCCSDHIHCCPVDTKCDLVHSTCVSAEGETAMAAKIPAALTVPTAIQTRVDPVPCNASVACAQGNTCCKSPQGEWACCPLPQAVCCEDHLHCCPHTTICNLAASMCDGPSGNAMVPWQDQVPVFGLAVDADKNKCDKSTSCPGKATCCKTAAGTWACCPLPQAVCCDDHVHCCPHGTVCNLEAETCDNRFGANLPPQPWVAKVPALDAERHNEKCDKQTMCPRGSTCCEQNPGQWACCPLVKAVCCDDHEHCCPGGYRCNGTQQTCDKPGALDLPWLQKRPALKRMPTRSLAGGAPPQPAENMCDAHTSCPKDTTCCFMNKAGKWGCCPLPKATCCTDGDHCCPGGYTCDPHRSSCTKGPHHVIPWYAKQSASSTRPGGGGVADVKCDDESSCAAGTTCCKLPTEEWGCCPLVKAVCCEDHEHCCPQAYSCNMQTGTCEKKADDPFVHILHQSRVVKPTHRDTEGEGDVPCDGTGEFHCPKQDTCCKTSATEWACCPSLKAVCCTDSKHCCATGSSCDLAAGGCTQQPLTWDTFFTKDRKRDFVPFGL